MFTDYALDPATGDYIIDRGDLLTRSTALNNVYLSLTTELGTCVGSPEFGSLLHTLTRKKALKDTAAVAREMCENATAWMLPERADNIVYDVELQKSENTSRLAISATVWKGDESLSLENIHFVEVI